MDLTYYEDIKYNFIEQNNKCNICCELFFENFKCKRCSLYAALAALPASIVFILLITTAAPCAGLMDCFFNWFIDVPIKIIYFTINDCPDWSGVL